MRKNILRLVLTTALTVAMLTACNKNNTGTTPETQQQTESAAPETSGENLVSTEDTTTEEVTTTKKADTTEQTTTEAETATTAPETSSEEPVTAQETTTAEETTTEAPAATEAPVETTTQEQTTSEAPVETTTEAPTQPETTTEAHEHSYTVTVPVPPNCEREGVRMYTCECGYEYAEGIPKTEHSYGAYVYNNDATYEADGTETATCSVCGAKDTRTAAGTMALQETTTEAVNRDDLQSFFEYIKENWNAYGLECLYAQEGFTETFPFVKVVSDTQSFIYYLEGGDTSPIDNFKNTHDMTIWHDKGDDFIGEFKEGKVHEVMFARSSY